MCTKVTYIRNFRRMAKEMDQWRALVNKVMNPLVP
jgi:hypothetical protein